jgi:hypothetical protein
MQIQNALLSVLVALPALAQYNAQAGKSAVAADKQSFATRGPDGEFVMKTRVVDPTRDAYGNAEGSRYDLAVDGAFSGQTVLVIDLYGQQYGITFDGPRQALASKVMPYCCP